MAGGITSGVTYLGIVVGSSVPPGIAAKARGDQNLVHKNTPDAVALSSRNFRRVITVFLLLWFDL
jgi:hypothetical protein